MYSLDIAQLVRSALQESGCEKSLTEQLDSHSTIALDLHDLPSIHISQQDDGEVWLWSRLGEQSSVLLEQRATELLQALMQGCHFTRSGQLQLDIQDGELVLKAQIHPDYLSDGRQFAEALNCFFDQLDHFFGSLLR